MPVAATIQHTGRPLEGGGQNLVNRRAVRTYFSNTHVLHVFSLTRLLKEGAAEMDLEMPSYDEYALWRDSIKHGTKQMIKEEMQSDPESVLQALARKK